MPSDFISEEKRSYKFKIGKIIASSLSGFVAGAVFATIVIFGAFIILVLLGLVKFY